MAGGHADVREGRHVACGLAYGGLTGIVGPWLGIGGGNANAFPNVFSFSQCFLHVGLCSHTIFYVVGDVATRLASDLSGSHRLRGPESTRSAINARA